MKLLRDGEVIRVGVCNLVVILAGSVHAGRKGPEVSAALAQRADLTECNGLTARGVVGAGAKGSLQGTGVVVVLVVPAVRSPTAANHRLAGTEDVVGQAETRREKDRLQWRSTNGNSLVDGVPVHARIGLARGDVRRIAARNPSCQADAAVVLPAADVIETQAEIESQLPVHLPVVESIARDGVVVHVRNRIAAVLRKAAADSHQKVGERIGRADSASCDCIGLQTTAVAEGAVGIAIGPLLIAGTVPITTELESVATVDDRDVVSDRRGRLLRVEGPTLLEEVGL